MTKLVALMTAALLGTVPNAPSRTGPLVAAEGQTAFDFGFKTTSTSYVKVFVDADGAGTASDFVEQATGFAVTLSPDQGSSPGGTVTFTVAPGAGKYVRIDRTMPVSQDSLWQPYSAFKAKTLEGQLDYRASVEQQLDRKVDDVEAARLADKGAWQAADTVLTNRIATEETTRAVEVAATRTYVEQVLTGQLAGTGVVPQTWSATGDGVSVRFPIPGAALGSAAMYVVTLSGVVQAPTTDYTIDLATHEVAFTVAPALGVPISVRATGYALGVNVGDTSLITATGGVVARPLKDIAADEANVLFFTGADPTGATSSSAAIASAVATGKPVRLPAGTYRLGSKLSLPSGAVLRGDGPGKTILVVPDAGFASDNVISNSDAVNGNTNITLRDFSFRSATLQTFTGTRTGMMRFENVDGLTIANIQTDTFVSYYPAIMIAGGVKNATLTGLRIKNTNPTGGGGGVGVMGGAWNDPPRNTSKVTIADSFIEANSDEALWVYGWFDTVSEVTITGNVITASGAERLALGVLGYNVGGQDGIAEKVVVSGNVISGQTNILTGARHVNFSGNVILGPTSGTRDAVFITSSNGPVPSDISVTDNVIVGATRYGVFASGTDVKVARNAIYSTTSYGIYGGTFVTDNLVKNAGGTGIFTEGGTKLIARNEVIGSTAGIGTLGGLADLVIEGNTVIDPGDTGISINTATGASSNIVVRYNTVRSSAGTYGIRGFAGGGSFASCVAEGNRVWGPATRYGFTAGWRKVGNYETTGNTPWPAVSGSTASRPSLGSTDAGFLYRDVTLDADGLPIWWNGTAWIDATGAVR